MDHVLIGQFIEYVQPVARREYLHYPHYGRLCEQMIHSIEHVDGVIFRLLIACLPY